MTMRIKTCWCLKCCIPRPMLVFMALPNQCDLRKHMRSTMAEVTGSLGALTRSVVCAHGCLAENLDLVLDPDHDAPYNVGVVAGARLFMALVVGFRPTVAPTRYVVFLGHNDANEAPPPMYHSTRLRRRSWRLRLLPGSGCGCRARSATPPTPSLSGSLAVPDDARVSVLVIDTTGGDARVQPWIDRVRALVRSVYEWRSSLSSGESSAARDGARILDFVQNQ